MIYKYSANEGCAGIPHFSKNGFTKQENSFQNGKGTMNIMKKYLYIHKFYAMIAHDGAVF